ncbi:S1C family serine protease [Streptomyces sp. H27-D2]|uniref:S1C family serine protease n=1 Tax=Streptomyces sp. H27-D2 TaxID=3046304 RepID=UPI002DB616A2|nr:trypsin-like peptidase domain-containing protein [Streptomyces sp. H27-D2]MEC4015664.1 trypsin-like peptidase domain-containing protein [Streptomyces sp. H27-D2]
MTENTRRSGDHEHEPEQSSSQWFGPGGQRPDAGPGSPAPPEPSYAPQQPITTASGVTIWPGGGYEGFDADAPRPAGDGSGHGAAHGSTGTGHGGSRKRRVRGPVALLAAVAIASAGVGGGTALLLGQVTDHSTASSSVTGTTVAASDRGTISGVAAAVSPSVVEINATSGTGKSTGSGVIISEDGEILTNNHVVSGAQSIKVKLSNGRTLDAKVVGTDPDRDMALIKAEGASNLKPAVLGDSDQVKVGDEVVAIGSPEGLTGTVTSGIVSALKRDVTVQKEDGQGGQGGQGGQDGQDGQDGQGQPPGQGPGGSGEWPFEFGGGQYNGDVGSSKTTYKALQTDASLNPGNSGGPLVDMDGRIIGINSAMYAPSSGQGPAAGSAGSIGLGFSIPINDVKKILDDLRGGGTR